MNVAAWAVIYAVCNGDSRFKRDQYTLEQMHDLYEMYQLLGWERGETLEVVTTIN